MGFFQTNLYLEEHKGKENYISNHPNHKVVVPSHLTLNKRRTEREVEVKEHRMGSLFNEPTEFNRPKTLDMGSAH